MKNTKNKVNIINHADSIELTIQIAKSKWFLLRLFIISALLITALIFSIINFKLFQVLGLMTSILIALIGYIVYKVIKIAIWYTYTNETYTIKKSSFSYQTQYSLYQSDSQTVHDKEYQIKLKGTSNKNQTKTSCKGQLTFYNIHPITKDEITIFESALDISLREFEIINHNLSALRNQDHINIKKLFSH